MNELLNLSDFIVPNWPAPKNVHALQTNRNKGYSYAPYDSFNLGDHVNDNPIHVARNRQLLSQHLPSEPVWLHQVHGTQVLNAGIVNVAQTNCVPDADASFTTSNNVVCVTMTADCLPVLLCDSAGTVVSAVHAGWRGLCDGALEASIHEVCRAANIQSNQLMAWLGPAIGPNAFEVGAEVREQFMAVDSKSEVAFIKRGDNQEQNKWLGDLYKIATQRLNNLGVTQIYGGDRCTFTEKDQFFSFRRDGDTGRMATLIWLA